MNTVKEMPSVKRKRESDLAALPVDIDSDNGMRRKVFSSPRVEIIPGLWRRIIRGHRSKNDAKAWTCTCGYVNHPRRHVFFDIPQFKCGSQTCKLLIPDDYEWHFSLAEILANKVCPLGNVKSQGPLPHCMIFSCSMGAEVSNRVSQILLGQEIEGKGPFIQLETFMEQLRVKKNLKKSVNMEEFDKLTIDDYWKILQILQKDGVKTVDGSEKVKISGFHQIPLDFERICKEMANGSPLSTVIRTGKGFDSLKHNEIYVPPKAEDIVKGKSDGLHAIMLFGGGMGKGSLRYYKFVNTHSEEFCKLCKPRVDGLKGGFGNVIADGLWMRPVKFLRYVQGIHKQAELSKPDNLTRAASGKSRFIGEFIRCPAALSCHEYKFLAQGTEAVGRAKRSCMLKVPHIRPAYLETGPISKNGSETEVENNFLDCVMASIIQNSRAEKISCSVAGRNKSDTFGNIFICGSVNTNGMKYLAQILENMNARISGATVSPMQLHPERHLLSYRDPRGQIEEPFPRSVIPDLFEAGFIGTDLLICIENALLNAHFLFPGDVTPHLQAKARPPPWFGILKSRPNVPCFGSAYLDDASLTRVLLKVLSEDPLEIPRSLKLGRELDEHGCSWIIPLYTFNSELVNGSPMDVEDPLENNGNPRRFNGPNILGEPEDVTQMTDQLMDQLSQGNQDSPIDLQDQVSSDGSEIKERDSPQFFVQGQVENREFQLHLDDQGVINAQPQGQNVHQVPHEVLDSDQVHAPELQRAEPMFQLTATFTNEGGPLPPKQINFTMPGSPALILTPPGCIILPGTASSLQTELVFTMKYQLIKVSFGKNKLMRSRILPTPSLGKEGPEWIFGQDTSEYSLMQGYHRSADQHHLLWKSSRKASMGQLSMMFTSYRISLPSRGQLPKSCLSGSWSSPLPLWMVAKICRIPSAEVTTKLLLAAECHGRSEGNHS